MRSAEAATAELHLASVESRLQRLSEEAWEDDALHACAQRVAFLLEARLAACPSSALRQARTEADGCVAIAVDRRSDAKRP